MLRLPIVISLVVELQGFLTVCSFFGPTHLAAVQDQLKLQLTPLILVSVHAAVGMKSFFFLLNVCWGDATKSKSAAEFLIKSSKLRLNPFE